MLIVICLGTVASILFHLLVKEEVEHRVGHIVFGSFVQIQTLSKFKKIFNACKAVLLKVFNIQGVPYQIIPLNGSKLLFGVYITIWGQNIKFKKYESF